MLVVPANKETVLRKVLEALGWDLTSSQSRNPIHPVFRGTSGGDVLWVYVEGRCMRLECTNPKSFEAIKTTWLATMQALAQGENENADKN